MRAWQALWLGVVLIGGAAPAMAENEAPRVVSVDVAGLHTIASETCLARVQTKPGMLYAESVVSEDIRRLYALGYFTDIQVATEPAADGVRVVFQVTEKPTITAVEFEGFRLFRVERLRQLLGVEAGQLYDPRKVKEGVDKLKAEYRRKGYSKIAVESSVSADPATNQATVYVVADEGPQMRIRRIFIEGNLAVPDRRILKLLKTKRRHWFTAGVYDEQVLEEDAERIRAFYRRNGYQDVRVEHSLAADPSGRQLYLHLKIAEGLQHRIGTISLAGVTLFPPEDLQVLLRLKPGAVYNTEVLQEDLRTMTQYYGDRGYIHAVVTPATTLDPASKRVDLALQVEEHDLTYVRRIDIRGNLRTKDVVVRREIRLHPGEPFDGSRIRRSIERLYNLGYFEEVNVDTQATPLPQHDDLIVNVKEAKTGSFSFGGGFSSVDRIVGLVEVEQRNFDLFNPPNFTGAGQDLRFRVEVGTVRRYFDLSFTEPWIFGHPVSLGVDAFSRTRLRSRNLGLAFEERRQGGGLRLGKSFGENLHAGIGYQLFRTDISDVVADASADLKAEQGRSDISVANATLTWDTRDNRFEPTRGIVTFVSSDLAGGLLAGNRDFYRLQGGVSTYYSHWDRFTLETRLKTGLVNEYDNTAQVPIFERFFAGGADTIRGFRERRVGPKDAVSNDPIGGEAIFMGTLEEVATILKDERGKSILKGSVFYDVGNVWRSISDFGQSFESGTGIGMRVNTPIGPVRVDLGFPITQLGDEKRSPRIHFNVSRSF
ncbi:MAG: outer membrane protein assembly factor BamA [Candidatus Omnitrophica bacterium]|nr:outer membrane protein assembly factor BamA [Candidatus Omnitrophota bacterium]